jgi:uncharacterized membrane protein
VRPNTRLSFMLNYLVACKTSFLSIIYLSILIHYGRLTNVKWKHVEETLQKQLSSWKVKLLSVSGRLVLINSVFANIILHMIFFFQILKEVF